MEEKKKVTPYVTFTAKYLKPWKFNAPKFRLNTVYVSEMITFQLKDVAFS